MAIVTAEPIPKSRKVQPDGDLNVTCTEDWTVITDDTSQATTDPLFFYGDPKFPAIGAAHENNSALFFTTFANADQESRNKWTFKGMQWSTLKRAGALDFTTQRYDDQVRSDKSWRFTTRQKVVSRAKIADPNDLVRPVAPSAFGSDEEPIAVRKTGEQILGVQDIDYIPVCTYVRNELVVPTTLISGKLVGSVNTDTIVVDGLTVLPQTCLLQDISVSNVKQSPNSTGTGYNNFRTVTYQLAINPEGWDIDVLNAGFYALVEKDGQESIQRIRIADGLNASGDPNRPRPTSVKQPIDRNGNWIDTNPATNPGGTWLQDIHFRVIRVKRYIPFAGFSFV